MPQGVIGFHFTHYRDDDTYRAELEKVSRYLVSKGVTAFWCTLPTVSADNVKKVPLHLMVPLDSCISRHSWRRSKLADIVRHTAGHTFIL